MLDTWLKHRDGDTKMMGQSFSIFLAGALPASHNRGLSKERWGTG